MVCMSQKMVRSHSHTLPASSLSAAAAAAAASSLTPASTIDPFATLRVHQEQQRRSKSNGPAAIDIPALPALLAPIDPVATRHPRRIESGNSERQKATVRPLSIWLVQEGSVLVAPARERDEECGLWKQEVERGDRP